MLLSLHSAHFLRCSRPSMTPTFPHSRQISRSTKRMATVNDSVPHVVRTAHEPRQAGMWQVTLSKIDQINSTIRLLRLSLQADQPPLRHLPGQYVDLQIPTISTVGGFTITSPPQTALPSSPNPYIELAIQASANNPPAAYLWQPSSTILNSPLSFRIGGNFAYPPLTLSRQECEHIDTAIFIAGGVGINPIMSMLSAMDAAGERRLGGMPDRVRVLYSSKRSQSEKGEEEKILFEERLEGLARKFGKYIDYRYTLFETQKGADVEEEGVERAHAVKRRRIGQPDLLEALGPPKDRQNTVVYVCGVPQMTDEFVEFLRKQSGMEENRVLCEKWW